MERPQQTNLEIIDEFYVIDEKDRRCTVYENNENSK